MSWKVGGGNATLAVSLVIGLAATDVRAEGPSVSVAFTGQALAVDYKGKQKDYVFLRPDEQLTIRAQGPVLVNLRICRAYPAGGLPPYSSVMEVRRGDGQISRVGLTMEPGPKAPRSQNPSIMLTKRRTYQIRVPEGQHVFRVTTTADAGAGLAIRVTRSKKPKSRVLVFEPPETAAAAPATPVGPPDPVVPKTKPLPAPTTRRRSPAGPRHIIVSDFAASDLDPAVAASMQIMVIDELGKLAQVTAVARARAPHNLTTTEQRELRLCQDGPCLQRLAQAYQASDMVTGTLGREGARTALVLKRLDLVQAQMVGLSHEAVPASGGRDALLSTIGPAVTKLYPEYSLRPGRTRGATVWHAIDLDRPPVPQAVFWVTLATAVAAGGAAGGLYYWYGDQVDEYNHRLEHDNPLDVDKMKEIRDRTDTLEVSFIALTAVGGALAVSALVMAFFTDWGGGDDGVAILPVVGPRQSGAAVLGRF